MGTIEKVRSHLKAPNATGFSVGFNGNTLTANRINEWQWDVTSETATGITNLYPALSAHQVCELVEDKIGDNDCPFNPFYSFGAENEALNRFMTGLSFQMCKPYLYGIELSAKDIHPFVMHRVSPESWEIDGKIFSFTEARKVIRERMASTSEWKYTAL